MNQLTKVFDGHELKIVELENEPWFVAKDVCDILSISKYRDAVSRLDNDERGSVKVDTPGGLQQVSGVNEFGLYNLVLSSRKPEAKQFKRWITHEVIPSIRKTGSYELEQPKSQLEILQGAVNEIVSQDKRITNLEETMRIDGGQEFQIRSKANSVVIEALGGKESPAYKQLNRKAFSEFWREFKKHFSLPRYGDLPKKQFEDGLRFIGMWQPSTGLRIEIETTNDEGDLNERHKTTKN
ncbi:BRO family, N-terminal domain [Salinibacillus kushneri]|uniref:BRO family, N-terminal domain n=1 Tax=Salinibacillus kushneri TaxID=237682 RepID=A0A1I0B1Q9_9BACI|nr:ORF6C domain-containing protein [Salinibacillus kushneri]SET00642.1 BRO family, N-terminal domain [Salinibacillus kushneri]